MVDSTRICEKHELPLDGNGECELCRLSAMPSNAPPARSAWWALIIPLLLLGAGVLWAMSSLGSDPEVAPQRGVHATEPRPAGSAPIQPRAPEPEPDVTPPSPTFPEAEPDSPVDDIPVPEPGPEQQPKETKLDEPPSRPTSPEAAEVPEWKWDVARKRVTITMYATEWCGVCRKARNYMEANQIDFMELDTDQNAIAKERLEELNPRKTIPTFQIDELVYVGFRQELFEANLDKAARKYL